MIVNYRNPFDGMSQELFFGGQIDTTNSLKCSEVVSLFL